MPHVWVFEPVGEGTESWTQEDLAKNGVSTPRSGVKASLNRKRYLRCIEPRGSNKLKMKAPQFYTHDGPWDFGNLYEVSTHNHNHDSHIENASIPHMGTWTLRGRDPASGKLSIGSGDDSRSRNRPA